ncbi:MAG: TonB-dependent receptor, partial [Gammaproteobacteria bacterium]|nr:TonB-dependent receptor [Gammaproteobacteria bacterium]
IALLFLLYGRCIQGEAFDEELEPMIVSATRSPQPGITKAVSISIITREEIEESGVNHIVEVLRGQGGVQINDLFGDGSRATVAIRGFGANAAANTLILVDGRRLNHSDLGAPDLNSVSLKDVERVEIVQGSAGILYGDQAVGGVVNIITRRPEALQASLSGSAGSYNQLQGYAAISNRHANGVGYRLTGEKRTSDNYRDNNELDYSNFFGQLDYRHRQGLLLVEYQNVDEKLDTPGALFADQVAADRRQAQNPGDFVNTNTWFARAGLTQTLVRGWELRGEYANTASDSEAQLSVAGTPGPVSTTRRQQEITPRLIGAIGSRYGQSLITLGVDLFSTDFSLDSVLGGIDDRQTSYGIYAQAVVPLSEQVTLTGGVRHAGVENDITGALLPPGTEISDSVTVGEVGLSVYPHPMWRLYGRVDTNYRFVLADEFTSASFGGVIPETQTGTSYEFGADWDGPVAQARLLLYRLDLNDEIEFDPFLFINTNIGDTRRRGLILEGGYSPFDKLSFLGHFSYVDAEVVDGPLDGSKIPFVAKNIVRGSANYRFSGYITGFFEVYGISDRVPQGDFTNELAGLPGYVIANLNLSYRYDRFALAFLINNVFDKKYSDNAFASFRPPLFTPETAFFPSPERNFLITLSYHYD